MIGRSGMGVLLCVLAASATMAQTPAGAKATLASPSALSHAIVVNDMPWRCDGLTCTGPAGTGRFDDQRSCRDLAQKVGAVAAFESGRGALAVEELARCNKYARTS